MSDVVLHLGDCLEYMRTLPDGAVDAVVTDPPYVGLKGGMMHKGLNGVADRGRDSLTVGDPWAASWDWIDEAWRVCRLGLIMFSGNRNAMSIPRKFEPYFVGVVSWHQRNAPLPLQNVPRYTTELVWLFKKSPGLKWSNLETMYDIPALPGGCMGNERIKNSDGSTAHSTQKPVKIMAMLLRCFPLSVLDPFMGTGTTGVACARLGINFIGCEISPEYFAIAQRRIAEAQMQPPLFPHEPAPKPEQLTLDQP